MSHPSNVPSCNLEQLFTYHPPHGDQRERYGEIRRKALELAELIVERTPHSDDQAAALSALRQAVMWANAAIALEPSDAIELPAAAPETPGGFFDLRAGLKVRLRAPDDLGFSEWLRNRPQKLQAVMLIESAHGVVAGVPVPMAIVEARRVIADSITDEEVAEILRRSGGSATYAKEASERAQT